MGGLETESGLRSWLMAMYTEGSGRMATCIEGRRVAKYIEGSGSSKWLLLVITRSWPPRAKDQILRRSSVGRRRSAEFRALCWVLRRVRVLEVQCGGGRWADTVVKSLAI